MTGIPDIDSVTRIASAVDGWLNDAQGRALYAAASGVRGGGAIVEIGSWKGRSTVWLAHGAQRSGRVIYAIDPHINSREDPTATTLDAFTRNLQAAGVSAGVRPLVMTSAEAASVLDEPVELLFVDGDHSLEGAQSDATIWLPRVIVGGTVMFHDVATSGYSGPRRVFQRCICANPGFHRVRRVGSMAIAERTSGRSVVEGVQARCFGVLLYLYDVEGIIKRTLRRARRAGRFTPAASSS